MKTVILIGPMATGKSSVSKELERITGIVRIPMDRVRWYYYLKHGFSFAHAQSLSFTKMMEYWKPFEVTAVKRIVAEFPNTIIDFGAGHSYFPDQAQFSEVAETLRPLPNVVLLLPTQNNDESFKICNERLEAKRNGKLDDIEIEANRKFVYHDSNHRLAKHIVYTKGFTPTETAAQIRDLLQL